LNNLLRLVLESSIFAIDNGKNRRASKMGTASTAEELANIKALVKDNPDEEQSILRIEHILALASSTLQTTKDSLSEGNNFALLVEARKLRPLIEQLSMEVDRMIDYEHRRQALNPASAAARRKQIEQLLIAGVVLNIFLAVALVVYFNRSTAVR